MRYKKPLNRSITTGCVVFMILISIVTSAVNYIAFYHGLYDRNRLYLRDLLFFVEKNIDKDDLASCTKSLEKSKKYDELQKFLDIVVDTYSISYLYVVKPLNMNDTDNFMTVINGIKKEEYENEYDELYFLGDIPHDAFSSSVMKTFFEAMKTPNVVSFFQDSEATQWGFDYSGYLPLMDSKGEIFAVLGADISVSDIHRQLFRQAILNFSLIGAISLVFALIFVIWAKNNIVSPVRALEKSVSDFAQMSRTQSTPESLVYNAPEIKTENEVGSLSIAITNMTDDIRTYAENIVQAERKVARLQANVSKLDVLAYQDALTHVKNKAAYDSAVDKLNAKIFDKAAAFAIVMIDLNSLKRINDTYGHERGNDYITGACKIICDIYEHSPVFRIGGDEFVVILENRDYESRDALYQKLLKSFCDTSENENLEPWKRFSAAAGMAAFTEKTDHNAEIVFKHADEIMYKNKMRMKASRL